MGPATLDDWGKLLLRIMVGGLMLFHGVAKLQHGIEGIDSLLVEKGLPEMLKYGVYVGEIVAPALLLVGVLTRISALVLVFNMLVAVYLAHPGDVFQLTEHGAYALEIHAFYILGALAVACLGPGRFGVMKR